VIHKNKKPDLRVPIGSRRLAAFVLTPDWTSMNVAGGARKQSRNRR
jgi:hypothetical protein